MADAGRRQQKAETLATLYVGKLRLECRNGAPKIFARPLYASLIEDPRIGGPLTTPERSIVRPPLPNPALLLAS
jgi:hypothetical protein